jgi:hypothetical protein
MNKVLNKLPLGYHMNIYEYDNTEFLGGCKGCITGGSEVRRRRAELGNSQSSLISKPTA